MKVAAGKRDFANAHHQHLYEYFLDREVVCRGGRGKWVSLGGVAEWRGRAEPLISRWTALHRHRGAVMVDGGGCGEVDIEQRRVGGGCRRISSGKLPSALPLNPPGTVQQWMQRMQDGWDHAPLSRQLRCTRLQTSTPTRAGSVCVHRGRAERRSCVLFKAVPGEP